MHAFALHIQYMFHAVWTVNISKKSAVSLLFEFCQNYLKTSPEFLIEETSALRCVHVLLLRIYCLPEVSGICKLIATLMYVNECQSPQEPSSAVGTSTCTTEGNHFDLSWSSRHDKGLCSITYLSCHYARTYFI